MANFKGVETWLSSTAIFVAFFFTFQNGFSQQRESLPENSSLLLTEVLSGKRSARDLMSDPDLIVFLDQFIRGPTKLIDLAHDMKCGEGESKPPVTTWAREVLVEGSPEIWGVAVAANGEIFVTGDFGVAKVKDGALVNFFSKDEGRFTGIDFDANGNLYVASEKDGALLMFEFRKKALQKKPRFIAKIEGTPAGLTVSGNEIFVINDSSDRVDSVNILTGKVRSLEPGLKIANAPLLKAFLSSFMKNETILVRSYIFHANGITADTQGNLYIANSLANSVERIDSHQQVIQRAAGQYYEIHRSNDRTVITAFPRGKKGDGSSAAESTLDYPHGITLDQEGRVYISQKYDGSIRMIDLDGKIHTLSIRDSATRNALSGLGTIRQLDFSTSGLLVAGQNSLIRLRPIEPLSNIP